MLEEEVNIELLLLLQLKVELVSTHLKANSKRDFSLLLTFRLMLTEDHF